MRFIDSVLYDLCKYILQTIKLWAFLVIMMLTYALILNSIILQTFARKMSFATAMNRFKYK